MTDTDAATVTRREVIKVLGAGTAGTMSLATATGTVAASHADTKKNHATISDDTAWLENYAPMLDLRDVPRTNHPELLGWRFTSTDSDKLDVGVYAAEYAVQDDWLTLTSHAGDHEWIYVFVDPDTGEIDHVSYAFYHWLRGYELEPYVDPDTSGSHPVFRVAKTYHNYVPLTTTPDTAVQMDVSSLGDYSSRTGPLYSWMDNGMESDLARGAVHNPWVMSSDGPLDAWWSEDGSGRVNKWIVSAWASVGFGFGFGIRGAEQADPGDASI